MSVGTGAPGPGRAGIITRRRLIQGGVAAGVVLSVPVLPLPALADEKELSVSRLALDPSSGSSSALPGPSHGEVGTFGAASASHRRLPVVEPGEFRMLGLSWSGGPQSGARGRVRSDGAWSDWFSLDPDPNEAPEPSEAPPTDRRASRGRWVDRADAVELVVPEGVADLQLVTIVETTRTALAASEPTAGATPGILPRSAWGAGPYKGTPWVVNDVRLAIVHHSVNANDYSAGEVPSIIRGIQRYHQDGNGWDDIAYNFVVDKWGRIWEGRAGGVDKGVVGGHTYGCNVGTIGVCYLGDLRGLRMPAAAEAAVTSLLSWKFNQVHAIGPGGAAFYAPSSSRPGIDKFTAGVVDLHPTVVGHQHFGSTACPGDSGVPGRVHRVLTRRQPISGVSPAAGGDWDGFWLVSDDGQAYPHGWTAFYGSMAGSHLNARMISLTPTASGKGYWMLAADGGIFSFGDAKFYGSTGGMRLNKPVVGMARTKSGRGYWLVAADGGIFSFGDAAFYGSMGGSHLNKPVVGMLRTPTGRGYWLFASDGGIFTFGDARFFGSGGGAPLPSPAVGVAATPDANGYWLALANGTVRAYGSAVHRGNASVPGSDPIVGIAATTTGGGYWLAARSGKVFTFGNAT